MELLQMIVHFNIFIYPVVTSLSEFINSTGAMNNNCPECLYNPEKGRLTMPHCVECYCDIDCLLYGDCCIDIAQKFDLHKSKPNPEFSCVPQHENIYRFFELNIEYGYYMTTTYLLGISRINCNKLIQPVTSNITGKTYNNIDCATRNNERYLIPWISRADVMTTIFYPPDNISLRVCDYFRSIVPISNCIQGSQKDKDSCDLYYNPVYDDEGNVYQNIYCYVCNGYHVSSVKSEGYNPLRVLTRFSEEFSPDNKILKCIQDEEWMDTIALKCRRILCFEDVEKVNKTCPVSTIDSHMKYFVIKIRLTILQGPLHIAEHLWNQIIGNAFSYISQALHSKNYSLSVSKPKTQSYWNKRENEDLNLLYVICWFQVSQSVELMQLQRDIDRIVQVSDVIGGVDVGFSYINNFPNNISFERFYQLESNVELCCTELVTASPVNEDKYTFISEQLMCPYIKFDSSEYVVDYLMAYIPHLNISLEPKQYHVNFQQKLVVCVNDIIVQLDTEFLNNSLLYIVEEEKLEDVVSWYLNVVCITSSLVCLALSFITFLSNPELRTLPGKTNMILIASLFLAQFMLISGISIQYPKLCTAIGIIIHYLWLSSIFWMHVSSFHMFKVFVLQNLTKSPSEGHFKHILKYAVYANGFPGLIIIFTIIANLQMSDGSEIGYGGVVCYLTSKELILYSFVIPLTLIIISNIIFFIFTIISIQRVQIMGRQTGGERNNVYIYLKLSVVTGLFWIVALLAETFNSTILECLSIILNGSQGVFLFVAFTANRNVLRLWKDHFVRLNRTSKTNSTSKTISTVIVGSTEQHLSHSSNSHST